MLSSFFKNQDEISELKGQMAKKYTKFKRVLSAYDCGLTLALNISSELAALKREIDEIYEKLKKLDPSCPQNGWL